MLKILKKTILINFNKNYMLKENFTTMKKISSCQIECEKVKALIDKMIDNDYRDRCCDSSGNLYANEIHTDRLDEVYNDDGNYEIFTTEDKETAGKLYDELQANNINSIICFI